MREGAGLDILATMHYVNREPRLLRLTETGAGTALLAPPCTVTEVVFFHRLRISGADTEPFLFYLEVAIAPQKQGEEYQQHHNDYSFHAAPPLYCKHRAWRRSLLGVTVRI